MKGEISRNIFLFLVIFKGIFTCNFETLKDKKNKLNQRLEAIFDFNEQIFVNILFKYVNMKKKNKKGALLFDYFDFSISESSFN